MPLTDVMSNPRMWVGTRPRHDYYGDVVLLMDNRAEAEDFAAIEMFCTGVGGGRLEVKGTVAPPMVQVEVALFKANTSWQAGAGFYGVQVMGYTITEDDGEGNIAVTFSGLPPGDYVAGIRQRHCVQNVYGAVGTVV